MKIETAIYETFDDIHLSVQLFEKEFVQLDVGGIWVIGIGLDTM